MGRWRFDCFFPSPRTCPSGEWSTSQSPGGNSTGGTRRGSPSTKRGRKKRGRSHCSKANKNKKTKRKRFQYNQRSADMSLLPPPHPQMMWKISIVHIQVLLLRVYHIRIEGKLSWEKLFPGLGIEEKTVMMLIIIFGTPPYCRLVHTAKNLHKKINHENMSVGLSRNWKLAAYSAPSH